MNTKRDQFILELKKLIDKFDITIIRDCEELYFTSKQFDASIGGYDLIKLIRK
jgi:hypothetical protein